MIPTGWHFSLEIGGVTYLFRLDDVRQYVRTDASAFTQRTSSGTLSLSDLKHIGAIEQRSFMGGIGAIEMIDPARYRYADGVDTRNMGAVTLWTSTGQVSVSLTAPLSLATDGTYLYLGGTGGVYAWDGTTLTNISTGLPNTNVLALFYNGEKLLAGISGTGTNGKSIHYFSGTVGAPAWTASSSLNHEASYFVIHNGWHFHSQKGTNLIHYWSTSDASDAETDIKDTVAPDHPKASATGDPGAVQVGPLGREVKRLVSYNDLLYAFRDDGIWEIRLESDGNFLAHRLFDFSNEVSTANFEAIAIWNGAMYFNVGKRFYRYTGGTLVDFTPPGFTMDYPPSRHDTGNAACGVHSHLYCLFSGHLYAFNGTSWHHLKEVDTTVAKAVMAFAPFTQGKLCALIDGNTTSLWHWRLDDDYARPTYQTSGTLWTSRFDAGFLNVWKHWNRLRLFGHIPSGGGSIRATAYSYSDNSVTKYLLGSLSNADGDSTVTVDGESIWNRVLTITEFPQDATGKQIEFKFDFYSDDSGASTPVLYGWLLEYVLRPSTVWSYGIVVPLADNAVTADGQRDPYTALEKLALLEEARESVIPLAYEDWLGHAARVYISAINIQPTHHNPGFAEGAEIRVQLSLIELEEICLDATIADGETTTIQSEFVITCELDILGTGELVIV